MSWAAGKAVVASSKPHAVEALKNSLVPDLSIVSAGHNSEPEFQSAREKCGIRAPPCGDVDLYFVSNVSGCRAPSSRPFCLWAQEPERWNPENGRDTPNTGF